MSNNSTKIHNPKEWADYAFCLTIGSVFIYALTRTIFSATIIRIQQGTLVTMGTIAIIAVLLMLHNRITRIVSFIFITILGLYIFYLARTSYYHDMHPWIQHFYDLLTMIGGMAPFNPALGRTAAWILCMAFAVPVVVFMFHKFNFYILAIVGILVFVFTWGPGFTRDETGFLLFLFVFCVILVRKMNRSVSSAFWVAPICALAVWFANGYVPTDSEAFMRRSINQFTGRMDAIGDRMFEIFNPTYFSFQSTGFSGAGGRLGGPVTLNHRNVMNIHAPGGIYIAGATSNTYTGFSWVQTLEEGDIYTHGLPPGQFEMLETAAALIRGATIAHERASISSTVFLNITTPEDYRYLLMRNFPVIGVAANRGYFLHSYLPIDTVSISMGRQRTGTIFRPSNAWQLRFDNSSFNYLPITNVLPTGDMQTPRLMSRGTGYHMQFLNVNPQLSFIEYLLLQTNRGVYTQRADNGLWWQNVTFGGQIVGLDEYYHCPYENRWFLDKRDIAKGQLSLTPVPIRREFIVEDDYNVISYRFPQVLYTMAPGLFAPHGEDIGPRAELYLKRRGQSVRLRTDLSVDQIPWYGGLLIDFDGHVFEFFEAYFYDPITDYWEVNFSIEHPTSPRMSMHVEDIHEILTSSQILIYGLDNYVFSEATYLPAYYIDPISSEEWIFVGWVPSGTPYDEPIYVGIASSEISSVIRIFTGFVSSGISPEIAHFRHIPFFGVEEMQILVDLFAETRDNSRLGRIPRETYLLQWLDMFAVGVLAEYANQVRQHFMYVPEIVPQRVHDLTLQIVDGLTNDFDRVMAIRDFLLQFPYTLSPGHVPRGVCFVDHFLFVGQEGYCTYFASAMAVMARIAGVPSRYVEGFVLPPSRNRMETITVTNRMAHAWVEVYLEGFGWLIVEATPTYAFIMDSNAPAPRGGGVGSVSDDEWQRMMERYLGGDPEVPMGEMPYHFPGQQGAATATTTTEEPVTGTRHIVINLTLVLPIIAVLGILTFLLVKFYGIAYPLMKVRKLSPNRQVVAYFAGILDIITYYTNPLIPGETPQIYGTHKGKRFAFKSDSVFFRDLITLYYKAKYSPHEISEAERQLMEEAYFDMLNLLKMKRLRVIFMYLRYIRKVGVISIASEA
ncbi:MAG: hypothetical protein FWC32_13260 [Firmicutes bacterium]|nr:hypothetical protein [Bacillota bacterium]